MIIGVDIDGVLRDFVSPVVDILNKKYNTNLKRENLNTYLRLCSQPVPYSKI